MNHINGKISVKWKTNCEQDEKTVFGRERFISHIINIFICELVNRLGGSFLKSGRDRKR